MRRVLLLLAVAVSLAQPMGYAVAQEPKTLKERLSDKASDPQRLDNCHVPAERRGSVPRPDCTAASEETKPATAPESR